MKYLIVAIIFLFQSAFVYCQTTLKDFPVLTGPYLGQKPPGLVPEMFAPGIVSTGNHEHSSPVFTPDLKEIYWSTVLRENGKFVGRPTYFMKMINGVWNKPEIPIFSKNFTTCENPFISPDGEKIYFAVGKTPIPEEFTFYFVNRVGDGWSEPVKLNGLEIKANDDGFSPSVSKNGTIYYSSFYEKSKAGFGLYYSKMVNGEYQKPVLMEEKFNKLNVDWTPYIAPDESYIIFSSSRDGEYGNGDLYICFREKDGSWGKVINMGDKINTKAQERFPNVSPDGKYLFFNRMQKIEGANPNGPGNGWGDVYWVNAKVIEELRPKE